MFISGLGGIDGVERRGLLLSARSFLPGSAFLVARLREL